MMFKGFLTGNISTMYSSTFYIAVGLFFFLKLSQIGAMQWYSTYLNVCNNEEGHFLVQSVLILYFSCLKDVQE